MKTTTKSEENQLMIAERQLRNALEKIEKVREQMISKINYELPSSILEKRLDFKEVDSLWNSMDCISSALYFLHDVED